MVFRYNQRISIKELFNFRIVQTFRFQMTPTTIAFLLDCFWVVKFSVRNVRYSSKTKALKTFLHIYTLKSLPTSFLACLFWQNSISLSKLFLFDSEFKHVQNVTKNVLYKCFYFDMLECIRLRYPYMYYCSETFHFF